MSESMSFFSRLAWAFACFFRVLLDGSFAFRSHALGRGELPEASEDEDASASEERDRADGLAKEVSALKKAKKKLQARIDELEAAHDETREQLESTKQTAREEGAVAALALLQREGRLVDFLKQSVGDFTDEDIGAAARVVHAGCSKTLASHFEIEAVRKEEEGAKVEIPEGYAAASIKLTGNVQGSAPYKGVLRHKGWRAGRSKLPKPMAGHDATIVAPAEVEL